MPTERTILTREGWCYLVRHGRAAGRGAVSADQPDPPGATLAAGPFLASFFGSRAMLAAAERGAPGARLRLRGRSAGRRLHARERPALDGGAGPVHGRRAGAGRSRRRAGSAISPRVFFPRVPGRDRARIRWQGASPKRGKYRFRDLDLVTRSPFGLLERRVTIPLADELVVYPTIGQLTRRWHQLQRQASENRLGKRHDRSAQQQEYHGLRDYRPGDSPRWIHWRTSARLGEPMVKEFEQQNEQDLAILIDPWLPRTKVAARAARGARAGDLVRGDGLPGDLPAPGPAAAPGLDRRRRPGSARARPRSSCCTSCSSSSPCMRPATEGGARRAARRAAAGDAPRVAPDHRLDPAAQPARGGRAVDAAGRQPRRERCWRG